MTTRWLSLLLILALVSPLASPAAAQTPAAPGVVPPVVVPAVPPQPQPVEPPTQIDAGRVPYQQVEVTNVHRAGAAALNLVYVPGKAITCGAGFLVAGILMLATFGSQYPYAIRAVDEGCGYPWYLKPENVAGVDPRDER